MGDTDDLAILLKYLCNERLLISPVFHEAAYHGLEFIYFGVVLVVLCGSGS